MDTKKFLIGILIGSAVGAALGVLFAPEKGRVTRRRISDSMISVGDRMSGVAQSVGHTVTNMSSQVQQQTIRATEAIKQAI